MREDLLIRARIPKNHWDCTLGQIPTNASHLPSLINYTKNIQTLVRDGKGLYFSNQPGRGKSGAAAVVAKCALANRFSVTWVEAAMVMEYRNGSYNRDGNPYIFDDNQTMYERVETCDLLVLDELYVGTSKNDYYVEKLLRTRIDAKRANIITSNMSPQGLRKQYPMLYSVLTEVTEFVSFDPSVNFRPKQ